MPNHKSLVQLEQTLPLIQQAPQNRGRVELIVCRPAVGERAVLSEGRLSLEHGLIGDCWKTRGYRKGPDNHANADMQLNLMNARAVAALEPDRARWPLAGDQFFVDFDLSKANVPAGTRLAIGTAIIEVTAEPHLGCLKFQERFGKDAVMFVNSVMGKQLNLRGVNAKVIQEGIVLAGDSISKLGQQQLTL